MSEEEKGLIVLPETGVQQYSDEAFSAATKSGNYLPRLQLMTSNSGPCKKGEFPINHYALIENQNHIDLGEQLDVLAITWRPKALEIAAQIIAVYDPEHKEFIRIQERSEIKDSKCMFGPEFLLYIPSVTRFATFFLGSKSGRREAPNLKSKLKNAVTIKSRLAKNKEYEWQAPQFFDCSTPFELPGEEDLADEVKKFLLPPETEIERAEEDTTGRDR